MPADLAASFVRFWAVYPAKLGRDKAREAWEKISPAPALVETILAAVAQQRTWSRWTKDAGQFVPNPATWLNSARWCDEVTVVETPLYSKRGQANAAAATEWLKRTAGSADHEARTDPEPGVPAPHAGLPRGVPQ
jgi:hypothetical protein